jgi:hypothetical protein
MWMIAQNAASEVARARTNAGVNGITYNLFEDPSSVEIWSVNEVVGPNPVVTAERRWLIWSIFPEILNTFGPVRIQYIGRL